MSRAAHVTVPKGAVHGRPLGLSFFVGPWRAVELLRLACDCAQRTRRRVEPVFLATVATSA